MAYQGIYYSSSTSCAAACTSSASAGGIYTSGTSISIGDRLYSNAGLTTEITFTGSF